MLRVRGDLYFSSLAVGPLIFGCSFVAFYP
jgi:hypothetical protein